MLGIERKLYLMIGSKVFNATFGIVISLMISISINKSIFTHLSPFIILIPSSHPSTSILFQKEY
jgi:hypothetical protein